MLGVGLKVCATAALLVLLVVERTRVPVKRTELTYWDGSASDTPGFDQEAAQQVRSGEPGDHLNLWEAPGYFNNRGIEDLSRDKMDARMTNDAAGSSWFDMGGPDFAQPNSLYNPATDTDSVALDNSYDNAWPGTGSSLYGWDDMDLESDAYDGEFGVQPIDSEAATSAVVSGSDLAGFKAVTGAQQLAECERCYGGANCVAGCVMQNSLLAEAGNRQAKGAAKQAAQKQTAPKSGVQQAKSAQTKRTMTAKKHAGAKPAAKAAHAKGLKQVGSTKQKTAQHSQQQLCSVACGGNAKQQAAACKCPTTTTPTTTTHAAKATATPPADGFMSFVRGLHWDATASNKHAAQTLRQVGVAVDADPFDEKTMPEQGSANLSVKQDMLNFFNTGHKLAKLGIKVD